MFPGNPQLKLSEAVYLNSEYLDKSRLDQVRMVGNAGDVEVLNSNITYALGSNEEYGRKNFPLLFLTQGMGNKRAVNSLDGTYYHYLFGKPQKTSILGKTVADSGVPVGADGEEFVLLFKDRYLQKNQVIYAGGLNGPQAHIHTAPVKEGSYWKYKARQLGGRTGQPIPFKYLQAGAEWGAGPVKVSMARSRGTEHRSYAPFGVQNQLSQIRHSFNIAGNAGRKRVINLDFNVGGSTKRLWAEWERYIAELDFKEKCENDLFISKYNKDANGFVYNTDADSGESVYSGMGLWWQVPSSNTLPFTEMSERRLSSFTDDMISITDQADMVNKGTKVIDVLAGRGLLNEIDEALKRTTRVLTPAPEASLFINKNADGSLMYGNYFTAYRHRSGVIFRFTHYPAFDTGTIALTAPRHPKYPTMPITSWYGLITNFGMINTTSEVSKSGQMGNIVYVYEEGLENVEKFVPGMAYMPGMPDTQFAATDMDASSWHKMTTQGIHCLTPLSLGKFELAIS